MKNKFDLVTDKAFNASGDDPYGIFNQSPTPYNPDYVEPWKAPMPAPAKKPKKFLSADQINSGLETATGLLAIFAGNRGNPAKQTVRASCGHRPVCVLTANCKRKKAEYQKCAQNTLAPQVDYSKQSMPKDNTLLYVGLGLGALTLIVVGAVVIKKMNAPVPQPILIKP